MPIGVAPLWEMVQEILHSLGVEHPNKGIEAGMMMEILIAEFLAGTRMPDPKKWREAFE